MSLRGAEYAEAEPDYLASAISLVYDRWIKLGKKPGSDRLVNSTRHHRPALVAEIQDEWSRIAEVTDEDLFPFHEDYVVRKWTDFRKMPDPQKVAWISDSKCTYGTVEPEVQEVS